VIQQIGIVRDQARRVTLSFAQHLTHCFTTSFSLKRKIPTMRLHKTVFRMGSALMCRGRERNGWSAQSRGTVFCIPATSTSCYWQQLECIQLLLGLLASRLLLLLSQLDPQMWHTSTSCPRSMAAAKPPAAPLPQLHTLLLLSHLPSQLLSPPHNTLLPSNHRLTCSHPEWDGFLGLRSVCLPHLFNLEQITHLPSITPDGSSTY
jgi:hypothetical protein